MGDSRDADPCQLEGVISALLVELRWLRETASPQRFLPLTVAQNRRVAMTASAMNEEGDRCLAAGIDDFISKPVSFKVIEQMITATQRK
jgi:CheY-like chemotaxis protein